MDQEIEWVAEVFPDWTILQLSDGRMFAFSRKDGRPYKLPHPDVPFIPNPFGPSAWADEEGPLLPSTT